ncbi:cytochrome C, partial [Xanthomonas vesicatoria]
VADFSGYSADLKPGKGTWSTASLKDFLKKDSKATFPNTKMKYEGLEDEKELDALIAYLNTLR